MSEIHHELNGPLNAAYLNIKAAFDSVDRRALWKALCSRGVPYVLTDLIAAVHENTKATIRAWKTNLHALKQAQGFVKAASLPRHSSASQ